MQPDIPQPQQGRVSSLLQQYNIKRVWLISIVLVLCFVFLSVRAITKTPMLFENGTIVFIERGDSLATISDKLIDAHVIDSLQLFQFFILLFGSDKQISAGEYYFSGPQPVPKVALQMIGAKFNIAPAKVTFPEGMTVYEMSLVLDTKLTNFDREAFMVLAKDKEGYLFPDTYFFSRRATAEEVLIQLEKNFKIRTAELEVLFAQSSKSFEDNLIMASIVEKEASGESDRAIIAGILWQRLAIGMPLQVDATLAYVTGKSSAELTLTDLGMHSPYNTYNNKGLPPTPIANPGLAAIEATLVPVKTEYLFYLHDAEGIIHYAKTFDQHRENKRLYLD